VLLTGIDEQKQRWLPELASVRTPGCFVLTEPGSGSDAGPLRNMAIRAATIGCCLARSCISRTAHGQGCVDLYPIVPARNWALLVPVTAAGLVVAAVAGFSVAGWSMASVRTGRNG
jgi:hypothetical protein